MTVSRKTDEFVPDTFIYCLPEDTDEDIPITLTLQKRGQIIAQMQFALQSSKAETLLVMPNILEFNYDKVSSFELHIKSDTAIFNYTTKEGKPSVFKFSLAGFKEKYLEQFI